MEGRWGGIDGGGAIWRRMLWTVRREAEMVDKHYGAHGRVAGHERGHLRFCGRPGVIGA